MYFPIDFPEGKWVRVGILTGWRLIHSLPTSGYGSLVTSGWTGFRGVSRGDDNDKAGRGAGGQANM